MTNFKTYLLTYLEDIGYTTERWDKYVEVQIYHSDGQSNPILNEIVLCEYFTYKKEKFYCLTFNLYNDLYGRNVKCDDKKIPDDIIMKAKRKYKIESII